MKKIGILTFHYSINEGAMLQGLALMKVCQRLFSDAEVEIINYEMPATGKRDFKHCFEHPHSLSSIYSHLCRYYRLNHFKNNYFKNGKRHLSNDYENSIDYINAQNYDTIIVGSDEVWKVVRGKKGRPFPNIYWLGNKVKAKKVSYAASANKTRFDLLSDGDKQTIKECLHSFHLIGVRDDFTYNLIQSIIPNGNKLHKVADPTLIIDAEDLPKPDITTKLRKAGFNFSKPAVVINVNSKIISNISTKYFHHKGWQVVGVTSYCKNADVNLVGKLNPLEWISILSHCNFSVTDRFHGTIFSLREKIPFVSVEVSDNYSKTNASKIKNLLRDFEMEDHLILCAKKDFSEKQYIQKLEKLVGQADLSKIDNKINALKSSSLKFLQQSTSL